MSDTELETVEMDLKGRGITYESLCATRRGKLSYCTRKMNDIKSMMKNGAGVDDVNKEVAVFEWALD